MKWRLFAAFALLVALVLVTQDVPLAGYLRDTERDRLVASLERDAFVLAGTSEDVLSSADPSATAENLHTTVQQYAARDDSRVVITDSDGRVVVATDASDQPGDNFGNRPEIVRALDGAPATGERDSSAGRLVYVAVPVFSGGSVVGTVRITYPASVIDDRANERTRGLLLVGVISLLAAGLAAIFMSSTITSPLRRLQRSTERLAEGDFSERAATNEGPPEIRSLARSFNSMTEQIAGLLEQQASFAGDASHQLRTPLTALRLQLERASEMIDDDPQHARDQIEAASSETERLQRLVEGLLMIARSEGTSQPTIEVDVSAALRERAEVWAPFAEERGIQLVTSIADGLRATAVPNAVEQIVDNYVDNAIGVVTQGGTVSIAADRGPTTVRVRVVDDGPGMDPAHLAHAFDRFWRAPDAPHDGSGIGLAVVRHLAQLSDGAVSLANREDGTGLIAIVELPAAP